MSIGEKNTGLDMKDLIGSPLSVAAAASAQLAVSTADFINKVGFDDQKKVRIVHFGQSEKIVNSDETPNNDEASVVFDKEVKESEKT